MVISEHSAAVRVWDTQSAWSQAADRGKQDIATARTAGLILAVVAACCATAAAQLMPWSATVGKVLAFVAAAAAGTAPLAAARSGPAAIQEWTRMRSVSEALKSEIYSFLAGVTPYRGTEAAQALTDRSDRIVADASDLVHRTHGISPARRPLPAVTDVDSYVQVRLEGQVSAYYRPRAERMRRRTTAVRRSELALAATSAVLGAASAAFGEERASAWVATITTVTAAVAAHAAAARYAYQELEYARTAQELDSIRVRREAAEDLGGEADDAFVTECERVISAQNEGWMAKWTTE